MAFFWGETMKNGIKKILIISLISALLASIILFCAFTYQTTNISTSFTETSNYMAEDLGKAGIVQENVSVKDNVADTATILAKISDNLDNEIDNIRSDYNAEVLGNAAASQTAEAAAPVASTANLSDYEAAVLNLINNIRISNGLGALQSNQILTDIARYRCSDMISNSYFSHYMPDGRNIFNILGENGVSYVNAGENLGQSIPASGGTPEAFANAWMQSPTHKANILRSVYSKIGIGVFDGGDRRVVATVFMN
jgi:uncharacterized protein YkwD